MLSPKGLWADLIMSWGEGGRAATHVIIKSALFNGRSPIHSGTRDQEASRTSSAFTFSKGKKAAGTQGRSRWRFPHLMLAPLSIRKLHGKIHFFPQHPQPVPDP